ncbi:TetR/AcrR family transcriptional regulator [Catenulispora rubra]|uniref:TetR/AcrR family transcriptional regulator n=1 Tax=Catenulispora rubra TaxID=280293 RepID=UPI0018923C03|nr:TetR/AcrR family transcriptional regulator [Catenulispora rubra]
MTDEPPRARRGRRPDLEARRRCLQIAAEMLQESGYAGLTMSELARRAGVSKKSLYAWWADKAAVVTEALAASAETPPLPDLGDTEAELRALFATLLRLANSAEIPLSLSAQQAGPDRTALTRGYIERLLTRRREYSRSLIHRGIDRGDLPEDTDIDALLDLWNGLAVYRHLRSVAVPDQLIDQLVALALNGSVPRLT